MTNKEILLELEKAYVAENYYTSYGICCALDWLFDEGMINELEARIFRDYMWKNFPKYPKAWDLCGNYNREAGQEKANGGQGMFVWEQGAIKPRLKWIRKQLKLEK